MTTTETEVHLVSLLRFQTPTEGALAAARLEEEGIAAQLGSDATATWLSYMGPEIAAAELFVREEDAERAREILSAVHHELDDIADEDDDEVPEAASPLSRAFFAAVLSWFIFPPVLNFYSAYLIVRHRLWETDDGWRYYAARRSTSGALSWAGGCGVRFFISRIEFHSGPWHAKS